MPGCLYLALRLSNAADVEKHHFPQHIAQMSAGVGVVAYIRDAIRREALLANLQQPIADRRRNPRVESVCDYVVERSVACRDLTDILFREYDVLQAELLDRGDTPGYRSTRQV